MTLNEGSRKEMLLLTGDNCAVRTNQHVTLNEWSQGKCLRTQWTTVEYRAKNGQTSGVRFENTVSLSS